MSENSRKHVRWSDGYDIPSALPGGQLSSRMQAVGRVCKLKEMCANPFLYDVVKCCKLNMCLVMRIGLASCVRRMATIWYFDSMNFLLQSRTTLALK